MIDLAKATLAFSELIVAVEGKDTREDLLETPLRAARGYAEMLDGYDTDIESLFKTFEDEGTDQIVVVRNIEFTSFCEHHLLPWHGKAFVAYLPVNSVIGISKIGRLVLAYAHRFTLQERLTKEVAYTLMNKLQPLGVAVVVIGEHTCMRCRGANLPESSVATSEMLGNFRDDPILRPEVMDLLGV